MDTELMQLNARSYRTAEYLVSRSHAKAIERDRLQERLFKIEHERRDLALREERELQVLHNDLLELLNRYWQLQG